MIARASLSVWILVSVVGCGDGGGQKTVISPVCGGTIATVGTVGGATFAPTSIDVIGLNGNAISIFLTDTAQSRQLWFSIHRNPGTNMFAPGSYQDMAIFSSQVGSALLNQAGQVTVELTEVVDPFDASGQALPGPDGGVVGSVAGSFAAGFTTDLVSGSFSSPVCSTAIL